MLDSCLLVATFNLMFYSLFSTYNQNIAEGTIVAYLTHEFAPNLVLYYPVVEETAPDHGQKVDNGQYLNDLFLVD